MEAHANKYGYSVIRILHENILSDKYKWENQVKNAVDLMQSLKKIQNIYIFDNIIEGH
jgi:hypothetical protein